MDDSMDAMMADGLLRTVREAAKLLYGENQTYPCDDVKRMMDDVEQLRAALREILGWHDYSNDMHKPIEVRAAYMRARAALEEGRT